MPTSVPGITGGGADCSDKLKSTAADQRRTAEDANLSCSSSAEVASSARLVSSFSSGHVQQGQVTSRARGAGVGISRAKIKTIKLTLTVVICYLLCWTPFYVAQLWAAYGDNVPYESEYALRTQLGCVCVCVCLRVLSARNLIQLLPCQFIQLHFLPILSWHITTLHMDSESAFNL